MDPVADKILTTSVFIFLVGQGNLDTWSVMLLLGRDTLIAGLRSLAASQGKIIAAKTAGKWKTALQMIAIPCLIIGSPIEVRNQQIPLIELGRGVVWVSVVLSIWSGFQYVRGYLKTL
jgi:CDP-diacylglycerol--glycerol-3-phosphate 3-phosphatidyltransferase